MRLTSSGEVTRVAEQVVRFVVEAYAAPDKGFDELRERLGSEDYGDPLREFGEGVQGGAARAARLSAVPDWRLKGRHQ